MTKNGGPVEWLVVSEDEEGADGARVKAFGDDMKFVEAEELFEGEQLVHADVVCDQVLDFLRNWVRREPS